MKRISLNKNWTLTTERFGSLECEVPCSLYSTLLTHGKIENPYYRENEYISTSLCDDDCDFECSFIADEDTLNSENIRLIFDGIDTIADIYLNGVLLGSTNNMHCTWEFDVSKSLAKENKLRLHIYSPNRWIADKQNERPLWGVSSTMAGYPHMRKAHCMFGWDWGPMLPDMGIWRDVSLLAYDTAKIEDVLITQKHEANSVTLNARLNASEHFDTAFMQVYSPEGELVAECKADGDDNKALLCAEIKNPRLWWTNGLGEHPLYTVKAYIYSNGKMLDERSERIGLRTLEISQDEDEFGHEFCFKLNGKKIFAMGANYIPEDQIVVNCTKERTRKLLEDCAAANYNLIRVWGGGIYPDNYFYDLCDELGIIVWQDFMFACSAYLLTDEFEAAIRHEIRDNVIRLRNHASLGLWCGNNEIESAWVEWGLPKDEQAKADYLIIFEQIIPEALREYGGETFYHPSSPSSGGGFKDPSSNKAGDMHYWAVWHSLKPIEDFRKYCYRFCSEYGFESLPSIKTLETIADKSKGDFDLMSPVMEAHQKCGQGNEKIMFYLAQMVRYPYSFERLIYSSQLLQADCIRSNVEHMRRHRGQCMGSAYWQVNDSNPVISWSSIDYYGRWKALHYYAKRFYAPILLSLEDGDISALRFNISNERLSDFDGEVRWSLRDNKSSIIKSGRLTAHVKSLNAAYLDALDLSDELDDRFDRRTRYLEYSLYENGVRISQASTIFVRPKEFEFLDPKITVTAKASGDAWIITLSAECFAKSVCLDFDDRDAIFEDNWFDIHAKESARITLKKNRLSKPFANENELTQHFTIETNYEG
ncbi:MAG: glycoside hydrolase family 2 protein [Ruminococcus sp.]|nr:glycoside hydrolase family 2 protein [Ruminococcus sp.]